MARDENNGNGRYIDKFYHANPTKQNWKAFHRFMRINGMLSGWFAGSVRTVFNCGDSLNDFQNCPIEQRYWAYRR